MNSDSLGYVEQLLADYLRDPSSVNEEWCAWFAANGTVVAGNGAPKQRRRRETPLDRCTALPYSKSRMKIEFDPDKDRANIEKHSVSLAFGGEVLADPRRLEVLDVRFDYGEDRFICYGKVAGRVWVCVFTQLSDAFRPISVRKANERETRRYDETPRPRRR